MGKYTENELEAYAATDNKFWPSTLNELVNHPDMVMPIIILDYFDPKSIKGKLFLSIVDEADERYLQVETTTHRFEQIFMNAFKDDAIRVQEGVIHLPWRLFVK
jgi:hypothetical protein